MRRIFAQNRGRAIPAITGRYFDSLADHGVVEKLLEEQAIAMPSPTINAGWQRETFYPAYDTCLAKPGGKYKNLPRISCWEGGKQSTP